MPAFSTPVSLNPSVALFSLPIDTIENLTPQNHSLFAFDRTLARFHIVYFALILHRRSVAVVRPLSIVSDDPCGCVPSLAEGKRKNRKRKKEEKTKKKKRRKKKEKRVVLDLIQRDIPRLKTPVCLLWPDFGCFLVIIIITTTATTVPLQTPSSAAVRFRENIAL